MVCPLSAVIVKASSWKSLCSNAVLPEDPICKLHKPTCSHWVGRGRGRGLSFARALPAFAHFGDGVSTQGVWHITGVLRMRLTYKHYLPQRL